MGSANDRTMWFTPMRGRLLTAAIAAAELAETINGLNMLKCERVCEAWSSWRGRHQERTLDPG